MRQSRQALVWLLAAGLAAAGCGTATPSQEPRAPAPGPSSPGQRAVAAALPRPSSPGQVVTPAASAAGVTPLPASVPVRLTIARIGVRTTLVKLGLNRDGTLQTPSQADVMRAGWYTGGPTPGQRGTSVIVGHVDSRTGPAVFHRLRELKRGDAVQVGRQDGTTARFVVDRLEQVAKDRFPTKRVYTQAPRPELRLITCGGAFDRTSGHYVDNVIVYAHLATGA